LQQFHTSLLENIVLPNGGVVIMQKEVLKDELTKNLTLGLHRGKSTLEETINDTAVCGRNGLLEIHCSESIRISHIIGPAINSKEGERQLEHILSHLPSASASVCSISSVQPRASFSILYELREDIIQDFIHFQFILKFTNFQNQW
jgi:hypothetical protein